MAGLTCRIGRRHRSPDTGSPEHRATGTCTTSCSQAALSGASDFIFHTLVCSLRIRRTYSHVTAGMASCSACMITFFYALNAFWYAADGPNLPDVAQPMKVHFAADVFIITGVQLVEQI
eukprot:TRINITY_DN9039_c0_g5_i2.p3 TRINITY_DN9039_c0_g5~~TRINITY_DN9039_c0_g5_i2.p3  ORF type:complete len:119 (-),score=0.81 TRINITY_DN9039_c0_g5_i2:1171-1527(-)